MPDCQRVNHTRTTSSASSKSTANTFMSRCRIASMATGPKPWTSLSRAGDAGMADCVIRRSPGRKPLRSRTPVNRFSISQRSADRAPAVTSVTSRRPRRCFSRTYMQSTATRSKSASGLFRASTCTKTKSRSARSVTTPWRASSTCRRARSSSTNSSASPRFTTTKLLAGLPLLERHPLRWISNWRLLTRVAQMMACVICHRLRC